jgi:hypothetical protein
MALPGMDLAAADLSGVKEPEQKAIKRLIDHLRIKRAKGGHIIEHHHSSPHPMEEHVVPDMDALHDHLEEHYATPDEKNEGEDEA